MSKKLVIQVGIKLDCNIDSQLSTFSYFEEMYAVSETHARKYAEHCGADYYIVKDKDDWAPGSGKHVAFQKFKIYDFLNYDQILYIDSDYIIKSNAPNIFDMYNGFAAVIDPSNTTALASDLGIPPNHYFNSGFMLFDKKTLLNTKETLMSYDLSAKWKLADQAILNKIIFETGVNIIPLAADKWNPVKKVFGEYGDHYSGKKKVLWESRKYGIFMNIDELYTQWKDRTRPGIKWTMTGDMPDRLDFLVENFSNLDTIVEFGSYQGCSTIAWLKCSPKKFIAVDYEKHLDVELYQAVAENAGIDFTFILEDDLKVKIPMTDLLFIDTIHSWKHTYKELCLHAEKAKKYIAFHDVNPDKFSTYAGITKYLEENPNIWQVKYHDNHDCGFLILERIVKL